MQPGDNYTGIDRADRLRQNAKRSLFRRKADKGRRGERYMGPAFRFGTRCPVGWMRCTRNAL